MTNSPRRISGPVIPVLQAIVCALVVAFYFWTGQTAATRYSFNASSAGYYRLLADGFLTGHTYLPIVPHADVLAATDPYDPVVNGRLPKLHDASLYKGKYFLYFGPAPALVLFVPFKLLTGLSFPDSLAVAVFCSLGFLTQVLLVRRLIRDVAPDLNPALQVCLILAVGFGNMVPVMIRRPGVWEVPIASGYFFVSAAFLFCYWAFKSVWGGRYWLAWASLALGLAVACRPTFVFGALLYCAITFFWSQTTRPKISLFKWILVCVPLGLIIVGLLTYNYARFERPFEFGTKYQLAGLDMYHAKLMSWRYILTNFWYYDLSPVRFSPFFPFLDVIGESPIKTPTGYFGIENVYGILPNLPFVVLGSLAPLAAWRERKGSSGMAIWTLLLSGFGLLMHGALLCFAGAASRYMVDFVPWLLLLAIVTVVFAEARIEGAPGRFFFRGLWMFTLGWTVLFNVFVSFQHNSLLEVNSPQTFKRMASCFNRLSPVFDWLGGVKYGPIELTVLLPQNRTKQLEPLVIAGQSYKTDYIYLYYTDRDHVQVGYEHTSYGGFVTQPVEVNYAQPQEIRIEMGSLYPPATHPYFDGKSDDEISDRKQRVRLWVNDVLYANRQLSGFQAAPADISIGENRHGNAFGKRFTGTIEAISRTGKTPLVRQVGADDEIQLALRFPSLRENVTEPLVVTGIEGRGDLLCVTYLSAQKVKFSLDHWGFSLAESRPITIDPETVHLLTVSLPNLHSEPAASVPPEGLPGEFVVSLDGAVVFSGSARFHPAGKGHVYILKNPIGGSTAAALFTGELLKEVSPAIASTTAH